MATDRRDRERQEMRDRITAAARRLFVEEGYQGTTIRAIADAIEYTPGAIYAYFKDKDAILYALHAQGFEELGQRMVTALAGATDPINELRRIGQAYLEFAHDEPEMYDLMFIAQATSRAMANLHATDEQTWPEGDKTFGVLRAVVARGIATGWVRGTDPDVVSFLLWSVSHGMVSLAIRDRCVVFAEDQRARVRAGAFDTMIEHLTLPRPAANAAAPIGPAASVSSTATASKPRARRSRPEL